MAVVVGTGGYAFAAPDAKAPAPAAPATAAKPSQVKSTPAKPAAPETTTPAKPAAPETTTPAKPAAPETTATTKPPPPAPVSAEALALQYQRVGHELAELLAKRGAGHALDQCVDLDTQFHTIKLNDALATPDSRIAAAAFLTELHDRILRWQGIQLARECLDNPLAKQCQ